MKRMSMRDDQSEMVDAKGAGVRSQFGKHTPKHAPLDV